MKIFIISNEKILSKSIETKINTILQGCEYEVFISVKEFESYYIKKLDKEKYNELVILDLIYAKESNEQFNDFCKEYELPIVIQEESWTIFLEKINSLANQLTIRLKEFIKELEIEKEEKKLNEPLHIYHKAEKEIVTVEVPTYIEVEKIVEVPIENKKRGFNFFSKAEKQNNEPKFQKGMPIIIGITSSSPGLGASTLCVDIANYLKQEAQVLILDRTDNQELANLSFKDKKIEIKSKPLQEVDLNFYDVIIIDFGVFFDIGFKFEESTILNPAENNYVRKLERNFCKDIVCVSSANSWKLYQYKFLINNPAVKDITQNWKFFFRGNSQNIDIDFNENIIVEYENTNYLKELMALIFRKE